VVSYYQAPEKVEPKNETQNGETTMKTTQENRNSSKDVNASTRVIGILILMVTLVRRHWNAIPESRFAKRPMVRA
jgi:hypothetical protein